MLLVSCSIISFALSPLKLVFQFLSACCRMVLSKFRESLNLASIDLWITCVSVVLHTKISIISPGGIFGKKKSLTN